jgi:hypothetical protein
VCGWAGASSAAASEIVVLGDLVNVSAGGVSVRSSTAPTAAGANSGVKISTVSGSANAGPSSSIEIESAQAGSSVTLAVPGGTADAGARPAVTVATVNASVGANARSAGGGPLTNRSARIDAVAETPGERAGGADHDAAPPRVDDVAAGPQVDDVAPRPRVEVDPHPSDDGGGRNGAWRLPAANAAPAHAWFDSKPQKGRIPKAVPVLDHRRVKLAVAAPTLAPQVSTSAAAVSGAAIATDFSDASPALHAAELPGHQAFDGAARRPSVHAGRSTPRAEELPTRAASNGVFIGPRRTTSAAGGIADGSSPWPFAAFLSLFALRVPGAARALHRVRAWPPSMVVPAALEKPG